MYNMESRDKDEESEVHDDTFLSLRDDQINPIYDIIDYLVRCANIAFKSAHVNEKEIRNVDKRNHAFQLFSKSPIDFLLQFGKHIRPNHLQYFETLPYYKSDKKFKECVSNLKEFHSEETRHKRVRNRRYKALQTLKNSTDYFSEKQMMFRNPLLYEQLIGQYLTDEEIHLRDSVDSENLTLLTLILDTVDRNQMRETKNKQKLVEDSEIDADATHQDKCHDEAPIRNKKQWGDFDIPHTKDLQSKEIREQKMINANERNLLRQEFLQEMYSSFIEGRDVDFDYDSVDNNEEYDDLEQLSQDAEDKYFDSEANDSETLEEHMTFVQEYGSKNQSDDGIDPLDLFMEHITNKLQNDP